MTEQLSNRFRERVKEMVVIPKDIYEKCLSHWDKSIRDSADSINIRQLNNFCQDSGGLSREQILKKVNIKYVDKSDDGKGGVGTVSIDDDVDKKGGGKTKSDTDSGLNMGIDHSRQEREKSNLNVFSGSTKVTETNTPSTLMRNVPTQSILNRPVSSQTEPISTRNVSTETSQFPSSSTQTELPVTRNVSVATEPLTNVGAQTEAFTSHNVGTETERLPSAEVQTDPVGRADIGTDTETQMETQPVDREEDEYDWDDYDLPQRGPFSLEGGHLRDPDRDYLDQVLGDIDSEGTDEYFKDKEEILSSIAPKLTSDDYRLSFIDWEEIPNTDFSSDQVERLADQHRNNLQYNEIQLRSDLHNRLRINRNRRHLKRLKRRSVIDRDRSPRRRRRMNTTTDIDTDVQSVMDTPPRAFSPVMENPVDEMLELQDELEKAEKLEQQEAETARDQDALERQQEEILASYDPEAMLPSDEFEQPEQDYVERTKQVEQTKPIMLESLREEDPEKIRAMEVRHLNKLKKFRNEIDRFKREYGKLLSQYKKTPASRYGRRRRLVLKKKMQKLRPSWREAVEDYKRMVRGADQKLLNFLNAKVEKLENVKKVKKKNTNKNKNKNKNKKKKKGIVAKTIKEKRTPVRTRSKNKNDLLTNRKKVIVLHDKDIEEVKDITKRNKSKPDLTEGSLALYSRASRGRKRKREEDEEDRSSKLKKLKP